MWVPWAARWILRGAAGATAREIHLATGHSKGTSRIVAQLSGPVSTPRSNASLIVTEHGVADLRDQPLSRRVHRLIAIAAPEHRESLERQAHELLRRCSSVLKIAVLAGDKRWQPIHSNPKGRNTMRRPPSFTPFALRRHLWQPAPGVCRGWPPPRCTVVQKAA